jgi:hypothetical protein
MEQALSFALHQQNQLKIRIKGLSPAQLIALRLTQ